MALSGIFRHPAPLQWRSIFDLPGSLNPQNPFLDHVPIDQNYIRSTYIYAPASNILTHRENSLLSLCIGLIFLLFRFRGDPNQMSSVSLACRKMLLKDAAFRMRVVRPGKPRSRVISRFDTIKIPPCLRAKSAASIGLKILERDGK